MQFLFIHSVIITQKETDGNVSLEGSCRLRLRSSSLHAHQTSFFYQNNEPRKEHDELFRFLTGKTVRLTFPVLVTDESLKILTEDAFERLLHSEKFFARDFYGRKIQMEYVDYSLILGIPYLDDIETCPNSFFGDERPEDVFKCKRYEFKVDVTLLEPFELSENLDQKYAPNTVVFAEGDSEEKLMQVYRDYFDLDKKLIVKNGSKICVASAEEELMYLQKEILESNDERLSLCDYLTLLECMGISDIDDSIKKLALRNTSGTQVTFCWDYLLKRMNVGGYKLAYSYSGMEACTPNEAVLVMDNHISLLAKVVPLLEQFEEEFKKSGEADKAKFFARQVIEKIKLDPMSYIEIPDFIKFGMKENLRVKAGLSHVAASFANLAKKVLV